MPAVDPERARALRERLCAWFSREARDLPWRRSSDPYAIWVSEAMLQQTRVEAARPRYERFLERLPTLEALAGASEDEVLALWSGLGYYRRARGLREAARAIRSEHGGRFPRSRAALEALPGIGRYTAGAILSIAFDRPEPLVDGNVARVLGRWFALEEPLGSSALDRSLWSLATDLVPGRSAGDSRPRVWNQALMELGATLCAPREPACGRCPVATLCRAHLEGRTAELPRPRAKATPIDVLLETLVVERGGRLLARRRPDGGRMAGLWELPTREVVERVGPTRLYPARFAGPPGGRALAAGAELFELRHGITRHRIRVRVRRGTIRGAHASDPEAERGPIGDGWAWWPLDREEPDRDDGIGWTGMARKIRSRLASPPLASGAN